jgi:hypothetical protein
MTAISDWHHHIRPSKTAIFQDNSTPKDCRQTGHAASTPPIMREIGPMGNARLNLRRWNVALAGHNGLGPIQHA